MNFTSVPASITEVWGVSADPANIRVIPATTGTPGAASLDLGFPPINFVNPNAGGIPPFGQDFNGAFNQLYAWAQRVEAGGAVPFNSAFSTAISGYPKGALIVGTSLGLWFNQADGNTNDPNSVTTNWFNVVAPFTGDSGTGGIKGYVPAPAAGDAAAGKMLLASGGWGQVGTANIANGSVTAAKLASVTGTGSTVALQNSPALTGNPTAPTPTTGDNDTSVATTAFVQATLAASPALGGNPTAPTPAANDNDTSIATTAFVLAQIGLSLPGFQSGAELSNDAGTPATVLDISAGVVASNETTPFLMTIGAFTKSIASTWTQGTGNGGLDTGAATNGNWYHVFVIAKADGTTDVLFSLSATAPTLPSTWVHKRRRGAFFYTAGAISAFIQDGDTFKYNTGSPPSDYSSTGTRAKSNLTVSTPSGVRTLGIFQCLVNGGNAPNSQMILYDGLNTNIAVQNQLAAGSSTITVVQTLQQFTDLGSHIQMQVAGTVSGGQSLTTLGWIDRRL